jgi:hypothetical protein
MRSMSLSATSGVAARRSSSCSRAVYLRSLRQNRGAAHADEEVAGGAKGGVGGDPGKAVGAAALQGELELEAGTGFTNGAVHLRQERVDRSTIRAIVFAVPPVSWIVNMEAFGAGGSELSLHSGELHHFAASPTKPPRRRWGGSHDPRARAEGCRSRGRPAPSRTGAVGEGDDAIDVRVVGENARCQSPDRRRGE